MHIHIGLGSNIGDRLENLGEALKRVEALEGVTVLSVSEAVESAAWPNAEDPAYANAVAILDTQLTPDALLEQLKGIEGDMGRDLEAAPNSPRIIDLDILLAGDDEWVREDLTVPHPRMAERDFVITPLLVLDPEVRWPDGSPVTRQGVRVGRVTATLGSIPGFEHRALRFSAESHASGDLPGREPLPGDEWVPIYKHPHAYTTPGAPPNFIMGGVAPDAQVPFAEMVLAQEGIPFVWDPFDPASATDPYGFRRPFVLMVPASMAVRAERLLKDVVAAPFDPFDAGIGFE